MTRNDSSSGVSAPALLITIDDLLDGEAIERERLRVALADADARDYFVALSRELRTTELWLVVELFHQRSGPPVDDRRFTARPASPRDVERALLADVPEVRHRIGYTIPDYLNRRLRALIRRRCSR